MTPAPNVSDAAHTAPLTPETEAQEAPAVDAAANDAPAADGAEGADKE